MPRRPCGQEVVGGLHALPGRLVEVAMRIDPAREDPMPAGLDRLDAREAPVQRRDPAVLDADVAFDPLVAQRDAPAPDHALKHAGFAPA
jgi:hypothetical protein